jgi:hypothetical protein
MILNGVWGGSRKTAHRLLSMVGKWQLQGLILWFTEKNGSLQLLFKTGKEIFPVRY